MDEAVVVRPARAADRPALVGLMAELQEFERALQPDRAPAALCADDHFAWLERTTATHDGFVLVAERGGAVVGFLVGWVETEGGTYVVAPERRFGLVSDLAVTAAARRHGIGRALLAAAESHFRAAGLARVKLALLTGNDPAHAFYRARGYDDYEVTVAKRLGPPAEGNG